ncbi:MAG TPA: hypothetical protein VFP40_17185 [Terriglobales bacterium]|nr:hypothetical protein [Terriglobales bacterium]
MATPDRQQIEQEIRRLETRRAELTRELDAQMSVTRIRFLSEDLLLTDRTLIVLRQQHARHMIAIDTRDSQSN